MKFIKRTICLLLLFLFCFVACSYFLKDTPSEPNQEDPVTKDIETIKTLTDMLEGKLTDLGIDNEMVDDVITKIEEYNNEAKYVVALNIKNEATPILNKTLHFPVNQEFFDSVEIGDVVDTDKLASLDLLDKIPIDGVLDGWVIMVEDKIIRE